MSIFRLKPPEINIPFFLADVEIEISIQDGRNSIFSEPVSPSKSYIKYSVHRHMLHEFCILEGRRHPLTHFMQMDAASNHLFHFLSCAFPYISVTHVAFCLHPTNHSSFSTTRIRSNADVHQNQQFAATRSPFRRVYVHLKFCRIHILIAPPCT